MIVDTLKKIYMSLVKAYSAICVNQVTKEKIVYLMSFPDNNGGLLKQLVEDNEVVVYYTDESAVDLAFLTELGVESHSLKKPLGLKRAVSDVTRSRVTICDNYFPFLGAIKKTNNRKIMQIWHATGAIKCFGLEDRQFDQRSVADQKRFKEVYQAFDYFVVASHSMADVFKRSYGAKEEQMLYLGFPRTDALFNEETESKKKRKTILYLPTYRENQQELPPLSPEKLRKELAKDYHLVIKLHPHIMHLAEHMKNDEFVTWQTDRTTESWLKEADVLITDYSSVAYDYALIHPLGKLIFYWYDETSYRQTTGIQKNIEETLPSEVCYNEEAIMALIEDDNQNDLEKFNQAWNTYNDGNVIEKVVKAIEKIGE